MNRIIMLISELEGLGAWTGTSGELAEKTEALFRGAGITLDPFGRNGVISYRQHGVLSRPAGKVFTWRHLLELAAARRLAALKWSRKQLAEWVPGQSPDTLIEAIRSPRPVPQRSAIAVSLETRQQAENVVRLLAVAVVELYRQCRDGAVLVHGPLLPDSIHTCLLRLGALKVAASAEDTFGSVHVLLWRCRESFGSGAWELAAFEEPDFMYAGLRLIDPDTRLPTLDAIEMARAVRDELDLLEQLAFQELRATSNRFVGRAAEVYTMLRRFVAEHPITTVEKIRDYEQTNTIQLASTFLNACYEEVQPHHLVGGKLHRCKTCKTPLRLTRTTGKLACILPQCPSFDDPVEPSIAQLEFGASTRVVRPHILAYWVGPAIDELAVARNAEKLRLDYALYPDLDACDVSLENGGIGIDIKSHASPFVLAAALSRKPGLLAFYPKKIVAINDRSVARVPNYLEILRREYQGNVDVEFVSVSGLLKSMKASE